MNPLYDRYINSLTVYHCDNKYRLGNKNDGGYVIMETDNYDFLLSGGVGGDISFEKNFTEKYNVNCVCFDGTENSGFELTKNLPLITYVNKNVGIRNTPKTSNFDFALNKYVGGMAAALISISFLVIFATFRLILNLPRFIFFTILFNRSNISLTGKTGSPFKADFIIETIIPAAVPCPVASPQIT